MLAARTLVRTTTPLSTRLGIHTLSQNATSFSMKDQPDASAKGGPRRGKKTAPRRPARAAQGSSPRSPQGRRPKGFGGKPGRPARRGGPKQAPFASKPGPSAATAAATGVAGRSISKPDICKLPTMAWKGPVKILKEPKAMADAVTKLLLEDYLGFDVETKPCFVRGHYEPPALVQVAGKDCVYIFQIVRGGVLLKTLLPLLECARVLKVGVGVKGDIVGLQKVLSFSPRGFVELSERTKKLGYVNQGLRALTALLLGGSLSKNKQMSNWANPSLTEGQIKYAATDAWVGREMYTRVLQEEAGEAHDGAP